MLVVALAAAPTLLVMGRYQLRTRDSFAVATATTGLGTAVALAVSYPAVWLRIALSFWVPCITDESVRSSTLALTSAWAARGPAGLSFGAD